MNVFKGIFQKRRGEEYKMDKRAVPRDVITRIQEAMNKILYPTLDKCSAMHDMTCYQIPRDLSYTHAMVI